MQVVLVYLQQFRRNSLWNACRSPKSRQIYYFEGSMSFKVIDVDISKKLVASACYDKPHVCAYLQPFSRYTSQ